MKEEKIQNQINESRLRWFGHIKRTDEHRIPKRLLEVKTNGRRPRGRPHTHKHTMDREMLRGEDETGGW
jgi:hypothetical protein